MSQSKSEPRRTAADGAGAPAVLVIGGGPAGLAAAEAAQAAGAASVLVAEQMPTLGRKLLMAGKSGLNLTFQEPTERFVARYADGSARIGPMLAAFGPDALRSWCEALGQETFVSPSGRVFPTAMKASPLLRAWTARLTGAGAALRTRWRWVGWSENGAALFETPDGARAVRAQATVLAMGGASWPRLGSDGAWATRFRDSGLGAATAPFAPSNMGVDISWSDVFRDRFAGQPIKGVRLRVGTAESRGEAVATETGLEGGGVYQLSTAIRAAAPGAALRLDLAPDRSETALAQALAAQPSKRSLSEKLRRAARLNPLKVALLREAGPPPTAPHALAARVKALSLPVAGLRPLAEAISSAGGVRWDALDADLMLRERAGVFCAGEMVDWDAPTGGYLLTACVALGRWAGRAAADWAARAPSNATSEPVAPQA